MPATTELQAAYDATYGNGIPPEAVPLLLSAVEWIGAFVCTAKDGGDAWCAVRNQPGASVWGKKLDTVLLMCNKHPKPELASLNPDPEIARMNEGDAA